MRKLTPEEREKLQTMIDDQKRDRERHRPVYLKRKLNRKMAERAARRMTGSGFRPSTSMPPLESTSHRTSYRLVSRNQAEIRQMHLAEREKEELKNKVWGKIKERHRSLSGNLVSILLRLLNRRPPDRL